MMDLESIMVGMALQLDNIAFQFSEPIQSLNQLLPGTLIHRIQILSGLSFQLDFDIHPSLRFAEADHIVPCIVPSVKPLKLRNHMSDLNKQIVVFHGLTILSAFCTLFRQNRKNLAKGLPYEKKSGIMLLSRQIKRQGMRSTPSPYPYAGAILLLHNSFCCTIVPL